MSPSLWPIAIIALAAALLPEPALSEPPVPIAALRWKMRPLLVFATAGDPRLSDQRGILAAERGAVAERDLKIIEIVDTEVHGTADTAATLRDRYEVAADSFMVVLIGKDGGEKLRSAQPITAERLFATIDAMPMRQSETGR